MMPTTTDTASAGHAPKSVASPKRLPDLTWQPMVRYELGVESIDLGSASNGYQREGAMPSRFHIATCTPNSTARSEGMRKNSVADAAFRDITKKSRSRHHGSLGIIAGTKILRPKK